MSVQHESAPSTAHHSHSHHHHSGHTFPATPVDATSPFSSDATPNTAEPYNDPDNLTALTDHTVNPSPSASSSPMPSTSSHAATFVQPVQTSASVSSPPRALSHIASFTACSPHAATAPSTLSSSSPDASAATSFSSPSSSSQSTSLSGSTPSSSASASSSSFSPSPPLSAIDRLRPSLQMYRNQVAGHSPLFWHSGTICKPLIEAEYTFYAQLEAEMPAFLPHVPKFYGLLDLEQLTEEMASSLLTETTDSSGGGNNGNNSRGDRQRSGSGENNTDSEESGRPSTDTASSQSDNKLKQSSDDSSNNSSSKTAALSPPSAGSSSHSSGRSMTANSSAGRIYNKWAMKCQLRRPGNSKSRIQYIVLEDLTYAYAKPCILDLKVGTRQHSDTEPPSKIASKTARCLHTTSHSLGLRLCGMQVYHPAEDMYQFRDKYWGRGLDVDGFRRAMRDYFWDGERIVEEVVRAFTARMEKMRRAVILWTKGRRFYSSSLLLVYEGDRNSRASGGEQGSSAATTASASGMGELDKVSVLRQGSDSSLTSTGSGFFSPLPSPVTGASSASPGGNYRSSSGNQPLATSASMASLSTQEREDSINTSPLASSSLSSSNNSLLTLSSSVPSMSTVPTTRATLPASFSSAALSSTFLAAHSNAASSPSSTAPSSSSASAGSTPPSSSSSLHSAPIKLYSHKRKTTHAQAMALARQRGSIDVRIIDFAHTSVVGEAAVEGGVVEGGSADEVDSGLLFGFDCLLQLLRAILEEERDRVGKEGEERADESDGSGGGVAVPADSVAVRASSDGDVSSAGPLLSGSTC